MAALPVAFCAVMRLVQLDSYVATTCVVASRPTPAPRRAENHFQHILTELARPPSNIWTLTLCPCQVQATRSTLAPRPWMHLLASDGTREHEDAFALFYYCYYSPCEDACHRCPPLPPTPFLPPRPARFRYLPAPRSQPLFHFVMPPAAHHACHPPSPRKCRYTHIPVSVHARVCTPASHAHMQVCSNVSVYRACACNCLILARLHVYLHTSPHLLFVITSHISSLDVDSGRSHLSRV